jgi:hypothetical protein
MIQWFSAPILRRSLRAVRSPCASIGRTPKLFKFRGKPFVFMTATAHCGAVTLWLPAFGHDLVARVTEVNN